MTKRRRSRSPKNAAGSIGPRLARLPELRALAKVANLRGATAWAVGGSVRDALLSRAVLDLDATVSGEMDSIARALEGAGFGRLVPLSEANPRAVRLAGKRALDLVEAEGGSIERDLARRDFAVNAMAVALPSGRLLDPHGGARDLRQRVLRMLSEENLADDPLRTFRAARFVATHGLKPDRATSAACRRHAPGLALAAPERVAVELRRILEAPLAAPALRWAATHEVLAPALRAAAPRGGRSLSRALAVLDAASIRRLPRPRRGTLRLALLSEALGLGPPDTGAWLRALRFGRDVVGQVLRLRELAELGERAKDDDAAWRWVREAGEEWPDVLRLLILRSPDGRRRARSLSARARRARRKPKMRGRDVMAWTGLPAGPRIGKLLAEVEVEVLRGRLRTRREARRWLADAASRGAPA